MLLGVLLYCKVWACVTYSGWLVGGQGLEKSDVFFVRITKASCKWCKNMSGTFASKKKNRKDFKMISRRNQLVPHSVLLLPSARARVCAIETDCGEGEKVI